MKRLLLRFSDVFISAVLLLVLAPLFLLIAILLKISSKGPIFFKHTRVSAKGEIYTAIKFRTMRTDSASFTIPLEDLTQDMQLRMVKHDPRITRIGIILRLAAIDDIPQLFNILQGNISLFSGNNASVSMSRVSSTTVKMPPLYTLLTRSLVSQRALLILGFLSISILNHLVYYVEGLFLDITVCLFCFALLLDIALIKLRYMNRAFGTSVQELCELQKFLDANFRRTDFQDWDGRGPLYPEVKNEVESESLIVNGARIKA